MLAGRYLQTRQEVVFVSEEKAAYIVRPPKLPERLREALRSRHYSRRTEQTYRLFGKKTGGVLCGQQTRLLHLMRTHLIYVRPLGGNS